MNLKVGQLVRLISHDSSYNLHIVKSIPIGTVGTVREPPNDGFPSNAVQVSMDGGCGAIEDKCLEPLDRVSVTVPVAACRPSFVMSVD